MLNLTARGSAADYLTTKQRTRIIEMGDAVKELWHAGELQEAFMAHRRYERSLKSADPKVFLWDQYDSKLRAALKKKLKETKATQEALKAQMAGSQA